MTDRELLYIRTVADEHNLSKAAEKLYLTQPSLSKCLQKIESDLGTKLFQRTSGGLILTFAGEKYYSTATTILKIYNDFEMEVGDINNLKKGRVTLGCTMYLTTHILPLVLPAFKERCPNIEVNIVEENSTELEKELTAGALDFAIMHTAPFFETSNGGAILFQSLFRDPFLLVTKKNHRLGKYAVKNPKSRYPKIDLSLFSKEPFLMVWRGQRIRQVSDIILNKASINPLVALTTKSYETARRLACQGIGVTFVPEQYSRIFTGNYPADYYSLDDAYSAYWDMSIAVSKNGYVSRAAQVFMDMVRDKVGKEAAPA